ncbi:hypothetical protein H4R18_002797 [Coemansia javaensis]|uniref:Uncharacterized protein n=1 Tax=Coemansia javaensis TaxID=2761396 RepID=A0A9W8HE12_9FUNG|nr:hypothetical protein H4R18_002797 [Coemansia javaensis]
MAAPIGGIVTHDGQYIWTPPAPDPRYWEHVAKARRVRRLVADLRQQLALKEQAGEDTQRLGRELRGRERKLMRIVDHYVLDYDDVVGGPEPGGGAGAPDAKRKGGAGGNPGLGTITPPTSPELAPSQAPPQMPAAPQPPAPAAPGTGPQGRAQGLAAAGTGLDSMGCIVSQHKYRQLAGDAAAHKAAAATDAKERSVGRALRMGLLGIRNVRPLAPSAPAS